jgi:hypothetical protein
MEADPEKYKVLADTIPVLPATGPNQPSPLLRYPVWTAPVLSHGVLYLRGLGKLAAFKLSAEPE